MVIDPSLHDPEGAFELRVASVDVVRALVDGDYALAGSLAKAEFSPGWPHEAEAVAGLAWHLGWLERDPAQACWRIWLIIDANSRAVLGSVNLKGRPEPDGTVEIGWGVEAGDRGRGVATRATRCVMAWVLAHPQARRIVATIAADNRGSQRLARRIWMSPTGELRRGLPLWALEGRDPARF
jgi:RimJ/RimL family protein N-acetyltransferase